MSIYPYTRRPYIGWLSVSYNVMNWMWRTSSYWYVDIFFWLNQGRLLLFHIKWRGLYHPWEILLMGRLRCVKCCQTYVVKYDGEFPKSAVMYLVGVLVVIYVASSQNGTISLFTEIYINLPLFRKYVRIYHFLSTRVWGTWVFHDTWVP